MSDLCPPSAVDEEFGDVAAQVLNRTCAMVNKYRRLLMVEAEVGVSFSTRRVLTGARLTVRPSPQRSSPSSEMVMIERTFNTEERRKLTQDKRLVLVDPGETERPPPSPSPVARLPLTSPLLRYRQLPGRLLLWDEIQTFPGPPPTSVPVQLQFQPVGEELCRDGVQDRLGPWVRGPGRRRGRGSRSSRQTSAFPHGKQECCGSEEAAATLRARRHQHRQPGCCQHSPPR